MKGLITFLFTDSDTLSWIEAIKAVLTVEVIETGVIVRIYQPDK